MLLMLAKVEGHSMEPILKDGSFFIASSLPYLISKPKVNEIVIFKLNKKVMVKRLVKIIEDKYYLEGDNKTDSLPVPPLKINQIEGRLIFGL